MRKEDDMTKYESPSMKFEKLTLFEKIAEECWGTGKANITIIFDYPYDNVIKPLPSYPLGSGCGNQSSSVDDWIESHLTADEYSYWINNDDNKSSNLANTKAPGFTIKRS